MSLPLQLMLLMITEAGETRGGSEHVVVVAGKDRASSPSRCPPVALIMTNGNDGISLPR